MAGDDDDETGFEGVSSGAPSSLFEILGDEEAEILDASPFAIAPKRSPRHGKRGPNRRTIEMRDLYLKSGFRHPMLFLGSILQMQTAELASELGCKRLDALDVQRKAAADLLPYLESKMPTKITVADEATPILAMTPVEVRELRHQVATGAMAIDDDARVEFQRLSAGVGDRSDESGSDGEAQPVDAQGVSRRAAAD